MKRFALHTSGVCHSMSTDTIDTDAVTGAEALTVGEKLSSFFKELSLGIDSFNAKNFNKSIHKVDGIEIWKKLGQSNSYFDVSTKHIPAPVMFNPNKISFADFIAYVLKAVPILKLVDSQTEVVYRGLKTVAATGKIPFTLSNVDNSILINETRADFTKVFEDTKVYTRAVNELYPNFNVAQATIEQFNTVVTTLSSRDVEIAAKRAEKVIYMINLLKPKVEASEVILNERESSLLNNTIANLVDNITFAGLMLAQLSEMTRVLQLQTQEARKL